MLKIIRFLIIVPIFAFLLFYSLDAFFKRQEARRFESEARKRITRHRVLENAEKNIRLQTWAERETSSAKIGKIRKIHGKNIELAAINQNANPKIITSIVIVESGGNPKAVSRKNAIGLMGVKPIAAKDVDADPKYLKDPFYNLMIGSKYFVHLRSKYRFARLDEQLLAYNRGPDMARALLEANYKPAQDAYVQKIFLALAKID